MNSRLILIAFLFFAVFPAIAYGNVAVNEVAWMGTINSAQDEWIELVGFANTRLDGWKLFTEDGGMSIALSGTIGSTGYFLIERTDDTTVPDITADLIVAFGSGLGNTGDVIVLHNAQGEEIDRVDGLNNWAIGGNNATKETLQRTSSGWTTALATPRAENKSESVLAQEPNNNKNDTAINNNIATNNGENGAAADFPQSAYFAAPIEQKLRVYAGKDQTALVGAPVAFEGYAEDKEGNALDGARFLWNFGDGSTGEGKKVLHTYYYPGAYRVFLDASVGTLSTTAALSVTVTPNLLGISEIKPGAWLEIINNASRTADIAGVGIRINNEKPFYFPRNSFLGVQSRLVLDEKLLDFSVPYGGTFQILYPNGSVFLSMPYPSEILAAGESLALTPGGWQKGVATPGATNQLIGLPKTAPEIAPPNLVFQKIAQPKTQDTIMASQQEFSTSELPAPGHASSSVENTTVAMPQDSASPAEASVFGSLRFANSRIAVLMLGMVVSVFASIAALFLLRFFS